MRAVGPEEHSSWPFQIQSSSDHPLSGVVTREGITVEVLIYRFAGSADSWSLEVVDQEGGSTVWTDSFFTDQAAHEAFIRVVEADGMGQFLESGDTLH